MEPTEPTFSFEQWGLTPWTVMVLAMLPLLLMMGVSRTYPTRRLAAIFALPVLLTLLVPAMPSWWWIVAVSVDGIVFVVALVDLLTIPQLRSLTVERTMAASLRWAVGIRSICRCTIAANASCNWRLLMTHRMD